MSEKDTLAVLQLEFGSLLAMMRRCPWQKPV